MMSLITIIISISLAALVDQQLKGCYCLNVEDSQSSMIDECIKFNLRNEFVYKWKSDLLEVEEKGVWVKEGTRIKISTFDQPEDYFRIEKLISEEEIDSTEVILSIGDLADKSICSLIEYKGSEYQAYNFDKYGRLKIKVDTSSAYGFDIMYTPHQFRFKMGANERQVKVKVKYMDKLHRTFFNERELLIENDTLFWVEQRRINRKNFWIQVGIEDFRRKFN